MDALSQNQMKDVNPKETKISVLDLVKVMAAIISLFSILGGVAGAWSVMQHRLDTYEKQLVDIKTQVKDIERVANERHELLVQLRTDMSILTKLAEEQRVLMNRLLAK